MRYTTEWKNYNIIGSGDGQKLENFGGVVLLRPDPQAIWRPAFELDSYKDISAIYQKGNKGGEWLTRKVIPNEFFVEWRHLTFSLRLMGFKQTGVFPEQGYNWDRIIKTISQAKRQVSVLNLFAYTGGATLAAASAGASVCHVDAAKAMCERAGQNAKLSGLADRPIRYIVDDCVKFVEREIRRGNKYDAIIMDPPSFGRGPKGEMWKLEDKICELVWLTAQVLSDNPLFYLINNYTTGLQPMVMQNVLKTTFSHMPNRCEAYGIGLPTADENVFLPCGTSAFMEFGK